MSISRLHGQALDGPFVVTYQPKLTPQQQEIVLEYLECDDGTRAELYEALAEVAEIWGISVCLRYSKVVLT